MDPATITNSVFILKKNHYIALGAGIEHGTSCSKKRFYLIHMIKFSRILIASLLILVFGVFTVGLPVVRYLCPLMNEDLLSCPYSPQSKSLGATITNETPSCCASYIVAERNTTLYTSVEKYVHQQLQVQDLTAPVGIVSDHFSIPVIVPFGTTTSPPPDREPLYVLNSSLLI